MAIKTIIFLILAVLAIAPLGAHGQDWFRVRDISETSITTKAKWAAQWLLAPKKLARVRNLYGYPFRETCEFYSNPNDWKDIDIGIGALVVLPSSSGDSDSSEAIARKLGEIDDRETLDTILESCQIAGNLRTDQISRSRELSRALEQCYNSSDYDDRCYFLTGFPLHRVEPKKWFWTESGIVERTVSQGWVQIDENWRHPTLQDIQSLPPNDAVSPDDSVYIYRNNSTHEIIGILPPHSRVTILSQYGSQGQENWASIVPSHAN